jgi:hypothetical protein
MGFLALLGMWAARAFELSDFGTMNPTDGQRTTPGMTAAVDKPSKVLVLPKQIFGRQVALPRGDKPWIFNAPPTLGPRRYAELLTEPLP